MILRRKGKMGCMRRRGTMGWLIASGILLVLYIFSVGWITNYSIKRSFQTDSLSLGGGGITIERSSYGGILYPDWTLWTLSFAPNLYLLPECWTTTDLFDSSWTAFVPLWPFILPIWFITFVKWRRRRRIESTLCRWCGYDLRALGDGSKKCPECGAERRAGD